MGNDDYKKFGIYIHIPYCLQRCLYCDFATYEFKKILPPEEYVQLLKSEISAYHSAFRHKKVDTVYFGGGTPSLLDPQLIVSILSSLANHGFSFAENVEKTIEINPATITEKKMEQYLGAGINRFSVGAQSFNDRLLKSVHREHNSQQTRETLELLRKYQVNFSFDILFALPEQTLRDLEADLDEVERFHPAHVSPYCLTVAESHPLAKLRLDEDLQIDMFKLIADRLKAMGYDQYEISNFAKPGRISRHNYLYWDNSDYWGIGLSSHSYSQQSPWGIRYWNPSNIQDYKLWIQSISTERFSSILEGRPSENYEILMGNQALTDFCHTSLRTSQGLSEDLLKARFGDKVSEIVVSQLSGLTDEGLVTRYGEKSWRLTDSGILVSNQVFSNLTFLPNEIRGL